MRREGIGSSMDYPVAVSNVMSLFLTVCGFHFAEALI